MRRLQGGASGGGGSGSSRMSVRSGVSGAALLTGRSALTQASDALDGLRSQRSNVNNSKTGVDMLQNPKEEGGYDYWLRFMEMDVRNFQKEEKVRKAHIAKRMADQRKYLDEQVAL